MSGWRRQRLPWVSACSYSSVDVTDQHRGFFPKAVSSAA